MPEELALPPSTACETVSFHFPHARGACSTAHGGMRNPPFSLLTCQRRLLRRARWHAELPVLDSHMPEELAPPFAAACGTASSRFSHARGACASARGGMRIHLFPPFADLKSPTDEKNRHFSSSVSSQQAPQQFRFSSYSFFSASSAVTKGPGRTAQPRCPPK